MFLIGYSILLLPSVIAVHKCYINHYYVEDGKSAREMVPSKCDTNQFCVYVKYGDSNPKRKQGWAQGCDKTDCKESENPDCVVWQPVKGNPNYKCRKHNDYGNEGSVCCCKGALCNRPPPDSATTSSFLFSCALVLMIVLSGDR
ncbi:unnamed protein product, partial [Mesorhabditis belari]|uniref:Uncharacterized protein n=1 Tax=Mesorhabditis belari TaxID=2138241 RepID=A0AAF3ESF3_9BILA